MKKINILIIPFLLTIYTVNAQSPAISGFTPSIGCVNTQQVSITGTNFTGATSVEFGGTEALNFTVNSNNLITATVGSGTTGAISITTPNGTGVSSGTFTVNPLPTLGNYSNTTLTAGGNTTITPSATPANTGSIVAYSNTDFTGTLTVNPATGVVTITNAKQAGTYIITVKAFGSMGCTAVTTTFTLTVNNPLCSQGAFIGSTDISVGTEPASVAIGDFNGDGKQDFASANRGSANVSIRLGDGLGGFSGSTNVGVGSFPRTVAIGDFNGDGKQDIATANNISSGTVSIRLGDGLGGFSGSTNVPVGSYTYSVAIGDFNGDGKQDFAAANYSSNTVSIRLGDGLGGFSGSTDVGVGTGPVTVAIGDFNGDGKQDFAVTNYDNNTVSIRLGDGLGGFSGSTNVAVGTSPWVLEIGDFNGDGKQDFATANRGSANVSIRLGDGLGGFSGSTNVAVGSTPHSVTIGDFNGDGKQDFAAANTNSHNVSIRLGDGLGGFSGTTNVAVGNEPNSVAIGDFNGDGRQDFATANYGSNNVSIHLGDVGNFNDINIKGNNVSIIDGDATPSVTDNTDFGITCSSGTAITKTFVLENTGTAALQLNSGAITFTGANASQFAENDITLPLSIAGGTSTTFTVTFTPDITTGSKNAILHISSDDCDETDYDFALQATTESLSVAPTGVTGTTSICSGGSTILTLSGGFSGTGAVVEWFTGSCGGASAGTGNSITVSPTVTTTYYVRFSGLCNTTDCAMVTVTVTPPPTLGNYSNTTLTAGGNTTITPSATPANASSIVAYSNTNFTGTLTVNPATGEVNITNAKQAGTYVITIKAFSSGGCTAETTFTLIVNNPPCSQGAFSGNGGVGSVPVPVSVAIGDFNGDGKQDFATANNISSGTVSIRLGDGLGGFSGSTNVSVGTNPSSVAIGDFNGDGKQDFAATNRNSHTVSIRLGDGLGGFSGSTNVGVGSQPISVAIGDFNGDGKQDFAAANYGSSTVSIRLGDGLGGFSGITNVGVATGPHSVAIGDFNGDGKQDFAVTNNDSNNVSILMGDGSGGFSGITNVGVGTWPRGVAIGDFNGDGKQDFATANVNSANVSIRLGDGLGGFSGTTNVSVEGDPVSVAIGDFNGDGKQDFAAANITNTVFIRLGDGLGGFSGGTNVAIGTDPSSVAIGDFNGDGKQDFATANYNSNSVSIFLGVAGNINDINIKGNGVSITDGDITPSLTDNTDFGITCPSGTTISKTFVLENVGTAALQLNSGAITFTGDNATQFAVSGISLPLSIGAGGSTTFTVTFTPDVTTGIKNAILHISSNDCDEADYDFAVQATVVSPTLGNYSNTTLTAGGNISITPSATPANTGSIVAYSNTDFTGTLTVNPATGVVTITNAKQAGTYIITVKAFGSMGCTAVTTTFTLTVNNPPCSQGAFSGTTDISVGTEPASVAIGDFNGDGKQDFASANRGSANVSIRLGDGLGGFSGSTNVGVGSFPRTVAIGDFNGDGKQDIATANNISSGTVSIRLGDGLGGFSGSTNVPVGSYTYSVAIGDFNGDGKQDFAAANYSSNTVSIRLGDGFGGFSGSTDVGVGTGPVTVVIGDFNGDGKQDFAVTNYDNNTVSIRLGDGLGGFSGSTNVAVGTSPWVLEIGDFNGDGKQDFATANRGSANVSIRLGDGFGGFSGSTNVAVGSAPHSVTIGDFNGDGKQDFAAANTNSHNVSIRLGDGLGGFSGTTNVAVGNEPNSVAIGDFNGDGRQDFATANYGSNHVSIRLGVVNDINIKGNGVSIIDGDSTPSETDNTDFGTTCPSGTAIAKAFVLENTGTSALQLNSGAITFTGTNATQFAVSGITLPQSIAAGASATFTATFAPDATTGIKNAVLHISSDDCDEADYDFAVQATTESLSVPTLGIYSNTTLTSGGNNTITPSATPANTSSIVAYSTTDFTGTLTVNPATGVVTITNAKQAGTYVITVKAFSSGGCSAVTTFTLTVNNPLCSQGTFGGSTNVGVGTNQWSVAIGDFNGDGKQDFAAANFGSANVSIRLGDGLGGFSGSTNVSVGSGPTSVAIGDFNGDGKQDFAVTNYYSNTVSIRMGDGLGGFSGSTNVSVGTNPWSVAIGDFNGDGKQDFAAVNVSSNNVSIRLGDGMGGFSGSTNVVVGTNPHQVAIGDFNGDGKQDFATANAGSSTVSIRMGDGMGGFSGSTNVSVGSGAEAVAIGDFNGDGKQDFAAVNVSSNNVSIRLGDGLGGFSGSTNVAVGVSPRGINIGDFNGDGKQDFATANLNSASVSIRLGDGLGGFSGSTNVSVGSDPYSLAIGDFNGDGRQDFATANYNSNSVSIFLGVAGNINDINIKGNGVSITDGDITPSLTDNTDFGITCSSGTTISKTFVLENVGTAALQLNSGAITFTGDNATQFAVSGISLPLSIEGGTSTTFTVTFTPDVTTGIKNAILHISSNDCDEADYDFAVQATQNANITYYTDSDGDGYGTGTGTSLCVNPGTGYASEAGDCNDADAAVNPAATEVCNNMTDDNCDGNTDEGCATYTYYADTDNDGYGNPASSVTSGSATPPTGYIVDNTDCNDINSAINPGATEICNSGVDDDCDGFADNADEGVTGQNTYYADTDGDGFGTGSVILSCTQPANTSTNDDDCNDGETMVNPGATELCNSVDDDCDGTLNEGFPTTTYYRDYDGDGKGNPAVSIASCYQPAGYVTNANDCDDNSATACPKPSGMSSSDITDVSATVSWGNLICATKYRLEYRRKTPPISAWTVVYSTSPTYTINGLSGPNIQYQWRVATICSPNGTSAESGYATLQSFYTKYIVYTDADMDGFGDVNVTPSYVSTMPQAGYSYNQTDCDDAVSTTRPGAPELCNGIDDDCDLIVDEGANWYQDADGDGLGNAVVSQNSCLQPVGYVSNSADCNDNSTTAACATPTNMTATNIGISFATINWTTSSCASSYTVMYRISPAGTFSTQFNTTGSSMMLSGLLPGTTYQARVRAKCPPPNTVSTSNWVYVTFTTNGAGLIEQVEEEIYTLEATGFSVYPNPGDGRFTLSIMIETDGELDIYVLDGFGKQVKSIHWSVYEGVTINEIDLTNLPDGVYHINIRRGEVVQTKKVVILK